MPNAAPQETDTQEAEYVHSCGVTVRPCPFSECRYSLVLTGRLSSRPMRKLDTSDSCSLDVAERCEERGRGEGLDEVGARMGLTRERVRQIELSGLTKLKVRHDHITGETK